MEKGRLAAFSDGVIAIIKVSVAIYAGSIPLAFVNSWLTFSFYVLVAIIWLLPDRRIEKVMR